MPTIALGPVTGDRGTITITTLGQPQQRRFYLFGRPLVTQPQDFGSRGAAPTHPELLDWLAGQFVRDGWRLKALHRLIMTSSAYRMSSEGDAAALAKDPANDWFWRFDMRRLSAEEVRDSLLSVSGCLNLPCCAPILLPKSASPG